VTETACWMWQAIDLENRRKGSQILNDEFYSMFYLLFILCSLVCVIFIGVKTLG
jgi:hypothetical protein